MTGSRQTKRRRTVALVAGVAAAALGITACSSSGGASGSDSSGSGSGASGKVTFGLITQLSVGTYFVTEADGAKAEAAKLGVNLTVVDSGQDASKDVTLTQTLITAGVNGIAVVPSNTDIGPRVFKLTDAAKIPVVASDSPLSDSNGKAAPFIGLDNTGSGEQVGTILGKQFAAKGWSADETYYANVEAPTLQVCQLRTNAALAKFKAANPSFNDGHVLHVPYDGTVGKATDTMRAAITAHPDAKHWVISSCNDDGVVGALKALQGTGFDATNALGAGLGGDLACQVYTTPYLAAGMPTSTYLDAGLIGATVVQTLYKIAVKKESVTGNVFVPTPEITKDTYAQHVTCPK